jgi:simple sugar transport system ATP-binding protein
MHRIRKSYFGNVVLDDVTLEVAAGEIHALVGENGAGKSTLMNILFGMPVIRATGGYAGRIEIAGKTVDPATPADAMVHGVGMVHQEFMLMPGFTIAENIKLNREKTRPNLISTVVRPAIGQRANHLESLDVPAMRRDARSALDRIGISLDERLITGRLPVGHMQFVEIAREVDKETARIVVFDEPTAVLTESEADTLLDTMRILSEQGVAILFITHRLDEVLAVAHRITVLRDGEVAGRLDREQATVDRLAELMIGRPLPARDLLPREETRETEPSLSIEDLHVDMPGEEVRGASFEVRPGEIFGLAGLAGQGKIGIASGIMGLYPATGRVRFRGEPFPLGDTLAVLLLGLAFVSEDRRQVGLLLDESVEHNIVSSAQQVYGRFLHGRGPLALYNQRKARRHAEALIQDFDIRCRGPRDLVRRLSGGNQQKVCLARAVTLEPSLLFVSEPTRGVDVGAKERMLNLLASMNREGGTTIVVTSSELNELRRLCDRIAVVDGGRIAGTLPPDAPDVEFVRLFGGEHD